MIKLLAAAVATLALSAGGASAQEQATARVDSGVLRGAVEGQDVASFKGVPYAAPPVGPLRWAPPRPAEPWSAPRAATAFGPVCPQGPVVAALLAGAAPGPASEDCLTLNVWAPRRAAKAPVMVWLHGGGNQQGAGSIPYYDGSSFARDGVVLVSLNYRLGPLGFFAHPALTREAKGPTGNYGLMDQIAALQWVRRNIAAFGGDPARVTVFGESAGGGDILMLLTTPAARGLFKQAIVESGGGWSAPRPLADAEARGTAAALAANLTAAATAAELRALPVSALDAPAFRSASGPMIDGRLITTSPAQAFASGRAADVPLIIGSNAGEDTLLGPGQGAPLLAKLTPERLAALRAAYPGADDALLARNLFRDSVMGAPARWIAARASTGAPAWLYHFAYVPPALKTIYPRTPHGGEIPFAFETLDRVPAPPGMMKEADRAYAANVHSCWVAFAKTGAPACAAGPAWPAYTPAGDALYLFDAAPHVEAGYLKAPYAVQEAAFAEKGAEAR